MCGPAGSGRGGAAGQRASIVPRHRRSTSLSSSRLASRVCCCSKVRVATTGDGAVQLELPCLTLSVNWRSLGTPASSVARRKGPATNESMSCRFRWHAAPGTRAAASRSLKAGAAVPPTGRHCSGVCGASVQLVTTPLEIRSTAGGAAHPVAPAVLPREVPPSPPTHRSGLW